MIEIRPHLKHDIVHDDGRVTHISSVHYQLPAGDIINETCVFYRNGDTQVRGSYDDHDFVVGRVLNAVALGSSVLSVPGGVDR